MRKEHNENNTTRNSLKNATTYEYPEFSNYTAANTFRSGGGSDALNGVSCEVEKCHYHRHGNMCGAPHISIQTKNAKTVEETDCSTFRLK